MIIDANHVSWKRDNHWVIKDIDWHVKPNEHWCLMGLNGSGKTTLLNIINGYIWPTNGSISVLGNIFGKTALSEVRKEIGWVSSSFKEQLPGYEISEDIVISGKFASIGLYEQVTRDDVVQSRELLESLGCGHLKNRKYSTLSQGEQQRVLIARSLMSSPRLLILDEPCTGLDIFAREQLLEHIQTLANQEDGPTLIYVTHHIEEILPCFSHTLLLKKGEIFSKGRTEEVITEKALTEFFETPISIEQHKDRRFLSLV